MRDKRLLIIFFVVLVDMLSFSVVLPLLPYLAKSLHATVFQTGLLTAMYPIFQFIGAPILGRLSDRFGRKPILLVSILGTAIGFVVLATARSLPVLFVSRAFDGLTGGNVSVAQAYISDITQPQQRGKALGMIGAAFGLGFVIGPVTGGVLSGISYAAPAWLGAALALANIALVTLLVPESLTSEDRARLASRKRAWFDRHAFAKAMAHKRVGPLLTTRLVANVAFGMFESGFSVWAIAALGLAARQTSFVLAYVGVMSVLLQGFLIGQLTKRWSDDGLLLGALAVAALSLVAWAMTGTLVSLIGVIAPLSYGIAVSNTVSTSALTKAVHHDEVGGILGLNTSLQALTRIVAPVIAAALIQYVAPWGPGLFGALLTAVATAYAYATLCWRPGQASCVEESDS